MQLNNKRLVDLNRKLGFDFSFSYPASVSNDTIEKAIKSKLSKELHVECIHNYDPVFFDQNGFLCKTLQSAYEDVTGMNGTPVTTTGGTYAKIMPNIVPFGPSFPGQKGIGHNPNEWMDRSDLILNAKIYALSIVRLANGKNN